MCAGCNSLKSIWKSHGKDKYCKECWYKSNPPTTTPKQRTPVKKISDKRKKEMSVYDKRRLAFLALNKCCQAHYQNVQRLRQKFTIKKVVLEITILTYLHG